MKKIWQSIVLFFKEVERNEKIADDIIGLLSKERNFWTEVEKKPELSITVLRFEKEGPYFGATISFEIITTTIKIGEESYVFWFNFDRSFHQVAFPELYKFIPNENYLSRLGRTFSI